jgi:HAD superfamily hydrolase (TIGR01509 family)
MSALLPGAVLWDMDGTLVDTEPYWMAEERSLVADFGGEWPHEQALAVVGMALPDSAAYILAHSPVRLTPQEVVDRLVGGVARRLVTDGVPWRPGARELLAELNGAGVPTALVTMSYRTLTDRLADVLPGGSFDVVVAGDDVSRGKPDPQPYLLAAQRLGLAPTRYVAIEDSVNGARSASAAGVPTLVVPHVVPVPPLPGTIRLPTLAGVRARDLVVLAGRARGEGR